MTSRTHLTNQNVVGLWCVVRTGWSSSMPVDVGPRVSMIAEVNGYRVKLVDDAMTDGYWTVLHAVERWAPEAQLIAARRRRRRT